MENTNQGEQTITLDAYRQMKDSGMNPQDVGGADAAPQTQEQVDTGLQESQETEHTTEEPEGVEEHTEAPNDDESIEIPENQKTAFQKALEREKRKAREAAEAKVKEELEQQYNPYKSAFERLGMEPQQVLEALERHQMQQEAQRLAEYNGWSDEQTQMFLRQQELERKQTEMQVNLRVYELADTADYPGIKQMKGAITDFIRSNPRASVEQAYWAVGGPNLAQQLKREAEQREIAKRAQAKRTVISDAPSDTKGPEPLPDEAIQFMRRTRMSEEQVRMMMKDEGPKNLDEYRKMMKRKG